MRTFLTTAAVVLLALCACYWLPRNQARVAQPAPPATEPTESVLDIYLHPDYVPQPPRIDDSIPEPEVSPPIGIADVRAQDATNYAYRLVGWDRYFKPVLATGPPGTEPSYRPLDVAFPSLDQAAAEK